MDNFAEALAAIRDLKREGIVEEYAVGGAMAVAFWAEPTATFDLDVLVQVQQTGMLVSLNSSRRPMTSQPRPSRPRL